MTETKAPEKVPLISNLHAPEVWATTAQGFSLDSGVIKITFGSYRTAFEEGGPKPAIVEIGRLVMPVSGALGLASGLYDFLRDKKLLPPDMNKPAN